MGRLLLTVLIFTGIAGCGGESWQTKDISRLMPPLELRLSGTEGALLTETDLQGRTTLLMFGFTACPDVCPGTLARLTAVKDRLPEAQAESVRIVLVSVDPARDSPERLAAYTQAFGEDIIGATGTPGELQELTRRYRTTYSHGRPNAQGQYDVSHSTGVYVFDAEGQARLLFRPDDSIEAMRADLTRLL